MTVQKPSESDKLLAELQRGWAIAREVIKSENDIINQRTIAFLTLQGFLFTALVIGTMGLAGGANVQYKLIINIFLVSISFIGFKTPNHAYGAIQDAFRMIHATSEWWSSFQNDDDYRAKYQFPAVSGQAEYENLGFDRDVLDRVEVRMTGGIPRLVLIMRWVWIGFFAGYMLLSGYHTIVLIVYITNEINRILIK